MKNKAKNHVNSELGVGNSCQQESLSVKIAVSKHKIITITKVTRENIGWM